ncbi:MAG: TIGR00374 family protein [Flavobacterium sp. BFFFF1]|uniref:lysylphosphatidylglycerol synthase transmembrane domain-containing protein n=1 Tax=Flavobacterium sp. BFFFF1 TaxID=2015557 RepID=UPI000BC8BFA6|nr:lysylphosphatidylglycerol synthase transmembrane domain-containing protein [Flavobacterium sp. BFFFF1]OYU82312.1 MAG: TIGR00374 family protein [Flavobacterium sp. BFFFF1]
MKSRLTKWLSITLPLLLGVILIVYTYDKFTAAQLKEIKTHFRRADYFYIIISLIISTLGCASRAYRWKFSLEHMGYKSSFANNFMAISVGYLMNLSIPRSGEFSRALLIKKYDNIPFDKGFGSIVAERIVDSIVLLFLMILTVFVQFEAVKKFVLDKIPLQQTIWLLAIGTLLTIIALLLYFYSKMNFILTLKAKVSGLKEGMLSVVKMKKKWPYIFHTLFIWVSYIAMFYITIFTLTETSDIGVGAVLSSFLVGSITIAVTSSGFGTYPVLMSKILLFYGITETVGNAFGWIVWISQILLVVITGVISIFLLPILNRKK